MSEKNILEQAVFDMVETAAEDVPPPSEDTPGVPLPEGAILKLDTKKYLWSVMGHIGVELPIGSWEEMTRYVEEWMNIQDEWEEALAEDLEEFYSRFGDRQDIPVTSKPKSRPTQDDTRARRAVLGRIFETATAKGIFAKREFPGLNDMSLDELEEVLATLRNMSGREDSAVSKTRKARRLRR